MTDQPTDGYEESYEDLAVDRLDCLRGNAMAMFLATIRFLHEREIPVGEWIDALGATFVHGWDLSEDWTPELLLRDILFNLEAFGAEVVQTEVGDDSASAVIERFPDPAELEFLRLGDVNGDVIFDVIRPIAAACGLDWSWRREGNRVIVETAHSRGHS